MADKSLGRAWYAIYRETSDDAARVNPDPVDYFSCRMHTARFLGIDKKQFLGAIVIGVREPSKKERNLTLADGTRLRKGVKNDDGKNAGGEPIYKRKTIGGRRVLLKTGKVIGTPTETENKTYHSLSFAFPTFATIKTISDALGTLIPPGKFGNPPSSTEIKPEFTIPGGGTYPIMSQRAAQSDETAEVVTSATAAAITSKRKAKRKGAEILDGQDSPAT